MRNTIEFKNGVGSIDLPTLRQTVKFEMANGSLPKTRPIEHFQFLENLMQSANRHGLQATTGTIYASQRQAMRINWAGEKDACPVENFLIQRLATTIEMNRQNEDGKSMGIAISFNERGIDAAFGVNVWACGNLQVFGEHRARTYGRGKVTFPELAELLENYLASFEQVREEQFTTIEELQAYEVSEAELTEAIGELFSLAVKGNAGMIDAAEAPLNQVQVADLVKASACELYEHAGNPTAYDIVQWGTHYLKPGRADLVNIVDHSQSFCNYIADKFSDN